MAQTGYTPILLYSSSTAAAAPTAGNLTNSTLGSELAINIADGKLFYKDSGGSIQVIAWKTTPTSAGGTGLTSYTAGDLLYYATGTTLSKLGIGANKTILTSSGTAPQWSASLDTTQGGTGLTSYAAGDLLYFSTGTTLSKLAIGSNTQILTSTGSAPQWSNASSVLIGTATNLAGGAQGSIPYQSAASTTAFLAKDTNATRYLANSGTNNDPAWAQVSLTNGVTGTLPVANGGTGTATAFTAGSVVFAGASGVYSQTNSNFFWDNTNNRLGIGTASPGQKLEIVNGAGASLPAAIFRSPASTGNSGGLAFYTNDTTSTARNWYMVANSNSYGDFVIRVGASQGSDPAAGTAIAQFSYLGPLALGGVTPVGSIGGAFAQLQLGGTATANSRTTFFGQNNASAGGIISNAYFDASNNVVYSQSSYGVSRLYLNNGALTFSNAASGTAGNNVTLTDRFSIDSSGNATFNSGTANGVAYLNGSKVLTTGSVLTFDGTILTGTSMVSKTFLGTTYAQTSTSGTTISIIDTGIYYNTASIGFGDQATYDLYFSGNPNPGGSGNYRTGGYGVINIGTGYNGAIGVCSQIQYYEIYNPNIQDVGEFTVSVTFYDTTEATQKALGTGYQIRIKIDGFAANNQGSQMTVRLVKRHGG